MWTVVVVVVIVVVVFVDTHLVLKTAIIVVVLFIGDGYRRLQYLWGVFCRYLHWKIPCK